MATQSGGKQREESGVRTSKDAGSRGVDKKAQLALSVCAVVVTYHPTTDMVQNLQNVLAQTQGLVVVDNGSNSDALNELRSASRIAGFHLIENSENLGIAEALNQGVRWVKDQGFPWVILFDQDSGVTPRFVENILAAWQAHPQRERVCSMHPTYFDPGAVDDPVRLRASDGGPITSMTSGALMPVWAFDKLGWFASEFFIDEVDAEYCYRIRAAGYIIADSKQAVLHHTTGHPEQFKFLGFTCRPTQHSATRRYYMSRNRIVLYRKYFPIFPRFVLHSMHMAFIETVKCLVADRDRVRKFRNLLLGTWDGLRLRMGKRENI
jgi:rhamnosyltransferase